MKRIRPLLAMAFALALICLGGSFAFADDEGGNRSMRGGAASVADPSSMDDWAVILGGETPNTANIGRIWTDKTVSTDTITTSSGSVINRGDSAFITALSALSSTSNVKSSSTTPLDIVLVLDASGSMDDSMDDGTKRIDALKSAANNFVNHIAEQNQGISDSSKQHQVSIVKFSGDKSAAVGNDTYYRGGYKYNYSQVMKAMSPCTDAAAFRNTINSINPAGSTRADYGLQLADSQTSNREDAKKIVIFFTDGSPTSSSGFESEVASSAVSAAKAMKDKKATVYTVGIFSGADPSADPSGASNENKFMHAVSSNYPEAAYTQNSGFWGGWDWNLGTRPDGSDFYKSATNADELKKVFDDISSEIVKGSGHPTNATEGAEHTSGYITFDDALGAYMQVDSFKAIALNGQTFENPTKTTAGNVDTYTFDGTVAMGDKSVSLGNVVITVTKSTDLAVGDKVQVKVPAALIPLRSYNVDQKSMTMTVSDTKPINVVYTSSLKPGVESLLANPDDAMSKYLQANSQDGKASFYSNDWEQGYLGKTVANFEPSKDNSYYCFTSDTPIYTDEACTQRAHQVVKGNTYWYKYSYYEMTNAGSGAVEEKEKVISFSGADAEAIEGSIGVDSQGAYFKAGTARLTYLNELYKAKTSNDTGTAIDVLNPKWVGAGKVGSYLGNNGKLSVDLPGTLAVTKQLEVSDGYSADDFANDSFEFTINMPDAATKSFSAVVKNANGDKVGDAFTLTFDGEGKAKHDLKAGETLYVYGLAGGWSYTVTESDRAGFAQVGTDLTGAIAAGETVNAKVVNTYSASGKLEGAKVLKGEKVLTGRDWNSTDKFTFLLEAPEGSVGVPMPEGANNGKATVEVTQDGASADTPVSFNFGDITYTKPGVYTYEIRESKELSVLNPGVSASEALYEVTVTVTDEGHTGNLTVNSEMKKLLSDDGNTVESPATVASFVNEYDTQEVKWAPVGEKKYTDSTDARPLEQGMFHVIACTNDPTAPLPKLDNDQEISGVHNGVTYRGAVVSVDANGAIAFPQATYTYSNLGQGQTEKTFTYKIMEVVWDGSNWHSVEDALKDPNFNSAGVRYDPTIWTVNVTLKNDNKVLVLSAQYLKNGVPVQGASFQFANSYDPKPATATIDGTKTLTGRDMADGETFGFELSAADETTQNAVTAGTVTLPGAATVSGAKADEVKGFQFGEITFKKPGEYTFNVNETKWNGEAVPAADGNGMQFDRSTKTVKVTVTDDHTGSLKAEVTYPNGAVAFANKYATSSTYNGIQVEKTLQGRNMAAGEFGFTIEGSDDASAALLVDADKQFTNESNRADGVADVMTKLSGHTFTQADSGKHYEFTIKETIPNGAVQDQATGLWYVEATGLYYDGANHVVTIDVADDGNGQLKVTTKVDGHDGSIVSFVNKYRAQDVSFDTANAELNKILQGRDWIENDSFDFTIKALDADAPMPMRDGSEVSSVTLKSPNSKDGDAVPFSFGQITFTSDMVKDAPGHTRTFAYEVTETAGNLPGIQYSTNKATIQITVSDNGKGQLVASATTQNGSFENRYSAELNYTAAGGLNLAKTLTGRDMTDGQFSIKITPADQAAAEVLGLPSDGAVISMPAANDGEQVVKSALSSQAVFDQGDAGETYVYTVVEQGTAPNGYTYDTAQRTVTIAVEGDAAQGTLKVTTVVSGGSDGDKTFVYESSDPAPQAAVVPFANSYTASGEVDIAATKSLSGRSLTDGEFNFALKYANGIEDVAAATNDASGNVDFGSIKYTTEGLAKLVADGHAVKTVKDGKPAWKIDYVAYEKTDVLPGGVSAQTQPIVFTVMVVDNGDGTLAATANTGNGLVFENVYSTGGPIEMGLSGIKNLKAGEGLTPASIEGKFTFTVTSDDTAAPKPERTTATNDANGNVDFGSIKFTLDDLNKALGTNGTRAADADDETKGASSEEAATDAAGQSASDQGSAAGADSEEQGNAAASDTTEQGQGAAVVTGEGTGAASVSTAANKVAGAEDADQASAQSDEPATRAGVVRSHTFTYKVTESGSADGVTNDTETKTVSFKVTDDGNGKLTVERLGAASDPAFTFTNTYSVQPVDSSVTDQVTVTKNLTGRDMKAGEFEFQLLEGGNVVATGTNDASGKVALSPITYTKPGTYNYTLCEVGGGSQKAGVQYDGSTFAVTTTVTDNGDGTLSVAHKVDNDANTVGFTNSYTPAATSVTLGASKVLNGKSLDAEEFAFVLTDEGGEQVTATNDVNGMVVFPAIQYGEAGTYQYTIAEVKGDESDVTYDESEYAVTVTVEDNGEGSLVATVAYEGGNAPVFTNTYNAPEAPASPGDGPASVVEALVSGSAKTGDYLLVIAGVAAAVAAAAAAVAVVSHRKKGKHAKR
ncbi:MAG: FctA domain-containing protein [Eggerthellaceae bacterium]|nr:FctA domain-containing protein [Eggerthellaceae bacterium]